MSRKEEIINQLLQINNGINLETNWLELIFELSTLK